MIPSVYDVVEGYRSAGRINARAAYEILHLSTDEAKRTPMDAYSEFIIDAFMYADIWLSGYIKRGCDNDEVHHAIEHSILCSRGWHKMHGTTVGSSTAEYYELKEYLVNSALDNYNSKKRGKSAFDYQVQAITQELGLDEDTRHYVYRYLPSQFPAEIISGVTGDALKKIIVEYCNTFYPGKLVRKDID